MSLIEQILQKGDSSISYERKEALLLAAMLMESEADCYVDVYGGIFESDTLCEGSHCLYAYSHNQCINECVKEISEVAKFFMDKFCRWAKCVDITLFTLTGRVNLKFYEKSVSTAEGE